MCQNIDPQKWICPLEYSILIENGHFSSEYISFIKDLNQYVSIGIASTDGAPFG